MHRQRTSTATAALLLYALTSAALAQKAPKASFGLRLPDKGTSTCFIAPINCGQVVVGALASTDCQLDDFSYIDFFEFQGEAGQIVQVDMISDDIDSFLWLLDPVPDVRAFDDDSGAFADARIVYELDATGLWTIGANSFGAFDLGTYLLVLQCTDPPFIFSDGFESGDTGAWQ